MIILITGTAGFIGFHLARSLLQEGHTVLGVDNLYPYYDVTLKHDRLALLQQHKLYTHHTLDLADAAAVENMFASMPAPDSVIHLAAQPGVRYAREQPYVYISANLMATTVLLEQIIRLKNKPRFIYASSSSVYGRTSILPFTENDRADQPSSLYAATKRAMEHVVECYTHQFDLQAVGLRFFTVYGPWGRPDMAVWSFTEKMLKNQPITLYDGGALRRDFTYIDDIIAGIKGCLHLPQATGHAVYNLGNSAPVVVSDFVARLARIIGITPQLVSEPARADEVETTYADISRAARDLGFSPRTNLDEGLTRFVTWYKDYQKQRG